MMSEKPVMAVARMGLTPMSPVMSEYGTVLIPGFARITKSPAELSGNVASG